METESSLAWRRRCEGVEVSPGLETGLCSVGAWWRWCAHGCMEVCCSQVAWSEAWFPACVGRCIVGVVGAFAGVAVWRAPVQCAHMSGKALHELCHRECSTRCWCWPACTGCQL